MTGLSDIEQLLAVEEIKLLKAQRDRACDTKDWDLYRALHADHHISHNDGHERWESADVMIEAVKALLDKGRTPVHPSHSPEITLEGTDKARGIWGMEDLIFDSETGELLIHGFGFYHETYQKIDGKWLFTSRQLKRTHVRETPEKRG